MSATKQRTYKPVPKDVAGLKKELAALNKEYATVRAALAKTKPGTQSRDAAMKKYDQVKLRRYRIRELYAEKSGDKTVLPKRRVRKTKAAAKPVTKKKTVAKKTAKKTASKK